MAEFSKLVLTANGQALMAKAIAGTGTIAFTKICTSSDEHTVEELEDLTEIDIVQSVLVSKIAKTNENAVKIEAAISNVELDTGYYVHTLGLYATDPDEGEILYAAAVENSGNCWMPAYNNVTVSAAYIQLYVTVGNADNVSLDVDSGAYATVVDIRSLEDDVADIMGYIGYPDESEIYGVEVDFANKTFTRLSGAVGKEGGEDFDEINAFGGRKRCILADDGAVLAYYGDDAFTTSGALTQAVVVDGVSYPVGTDCQVMVEQPAFYYKVVPLVRDGQDLVKARYYVSDKQVNGFKLHPAFIEDTKINDKIYLSAFEGCIYRNGAYVLDDTQALDLDSDKLSSIAGAKPCSGATSGSQNLYRSATRKIAENRGAGWEQIYAATVAASQLLMLVEYATFNMQDAIGEGCVNKEDGSGNESENTGATEELGNASGAVENANGIQIVSYRGEENFWGNIWSWVDGMNIQNPSDWGGSSDPGNTSYYGNLYVADHGFADDTAEEPYVDTGIHPVFGSAYVSRFGYNEDFDWMFIPTKLEGDSELPIGDWCWNYNSGWRVADLGGRWYHGLRAGAFCWNLDADSSTRGRYDGGRLVYVPSKNSAA